MPESSFSDPMADLIVDTGNPVFNRTVNSFLWIGTIAATRVAATDAYYILKKGKVTPPRYGQSLRKMCKEGVHWGNVAGLYVGFEYGLELVRGTSDWKNAMFSGALTGAMLSSANNNKKEKVAADAITGAAVATAAEFLNYVTCTEPSKSSSSSLSP